MSPMPSMAAVSTVVVMYVVVLIFDIQTGQITDFIAIGAAAGKGADNNGCFCAALFQFVQGTFDRVWIRHGKGKFDFVAFHQWLYRYAQIFIPVKVGAMSKQDDTGIFFGQRQIAAGFALHPHGQMLWFDLEVIECCIFR